jgi:glycine oxidase
MARLSGLRVLVAGAGAVGSTVALRLQDEGADVVLADPAPLGANASGVAAGMLAPAFEATLDPVSAGHFNLLRTARDLWPELAARLAGFGAGLDLSGALWVGDEASNQAAVARLTALGAQAEQLDAAQTRRLSPGIEAPAGAVFSPEDWTLEPMQMLRALRGAFEVGGGVVTADRVRVGQEIGADVLVLATGLSADAPPGMVTLTPIKGQLALLSAAAPRQGPVARTEGIYVVPRGAGPVVGATMEAGACDLEVEPDAIDRLKAAAARLYPALGSAEAKGFAGVRASTPDGLPLAGRSRMPDVRLAMGARRNGWLLAPLIAEAIADDLSGGRPGRWARMLDPARF